MADTIECPHCHYPTTRYLVGTYTCEQCFKVIGEGAVEQLVAQLPPNPKQAYGDKSVPDFMAVGGWDGMAAIFDVIQQTRGAFDGDQAMAILKTWKNPESPRGPIEIDPATRDIVQTVYIRRVEERNGHLANVEFDSIPLVKDPWKELNPAK